MTPTRAPSLDDLRAHSPAIGPVVRAGRRPFWSVMIPTYNSGDYVRRTLESVLNQDPGPDCMQIEVVDGCSTKDDPSEIVRELGQGRVAFHRMSANRGSTHTFNTCIERAQGQWVHILHGDDMVLPDFYKAYGEVLQRHPEARGAFGQTIYIDDRERWTGLWGPTPPAGGGILEDFAVRQAYEQLALFPSVVVRRDSYEQAGGFCTLFEHVGDWDMWFRVGQLGPMAIVSRPYALCRRHTASETNRLMASASEIRESHLLMQMNAARLSQPVPAGTERQTHAKWAAYADTTAWKMNQVGAVEGRYNYAQWAWRLEPTTPRLIMLAKSWLKHSLKKAKQ